MKRKISKVSLLILALCLGVVGGIVGFLGGKYIPRDFVLDDFLLYILGIFFLYAH